MRYRGLATEGTENTEELKGGQLIEQTIAAVIEVHRWPCPGLLKSACEKAGSVDKR